MDLAADEEQQLFGVLEEGGLGRTWLPGIGFRPSLRSPARRGQARRRTRVVVDGPDPRVGSDLQVCAHLVAACVSWFALWED